MFTYVDAEMWATGYLRAALGAYTDRQGQPAEVAVGNRVPNPRQLRMVVIRRDGGRATDIVRDSARLSLRVWGPDGDEAEATHLANVVRAHMSDAPGIGPCRRWAELSGPTAIADESEQPLRYIVGEALLRGEEQ